MTEDSIDNKHSKCEIGLNLCKHSPLDEWYVIKYLTPGLKTKNFVLGVLRPSLTKTLRPGLKTKTFIKWTPVLSRPETLVSGSQNCCRSCLAINILQGTKHEHQKQKYKVSNTANSCEFLSHFMCHALQVAFLVSFQGE